MAFAFLCAPLVVQHLPFAVCFVFVLAGRFQDTCVTLVCMARRTTAHRTMPNNLARRPLDGAGGGGAGVGALALEADQGGGAPTVRQAPLRLLADRVADQTTKHQNKLHPAAQNRSVD